MTVSRMCATPASMDDDCAWIVVERAYMIHPFPSQGGAPVAPPVLPTPSSAGLAITMGKYVGWSGVYRCAGCGHRASPYRRFDRVSVRVLLSAGRRTLQHLRPARDGRGGDHRDWRRFR